MKIPKNEELCTTYCEAGGKEVFVMTRDLFGITYFLYDVSDGTMKRLGKAASPIELEKKHSVNEKILTNH